MRIIVLDIEGTLISNAVSIFPRHNLYNFLTFLKGKYDKIVFGCEWGGGIPCEKLKDEPFDEFYFPGWISPKNETNSGW